jgi:hypothetical protein
MTNIARKYSGRLGLYKGVQPNLYEDGKYWNREDRWPSPVITGRQSNNTITIVNKETLNFITSAGAATNVTGTITLITKDASKIVHIGASNTTSNAYFTVYNTAGTILNQQFFDSSVVSPPLENVFPWGSTINASDEIIVINNKNLFKMNLDGLVTENLVEFPVGFGLWTSRTRIFTDIDGNIYFNSAIPTKSILKYSPVGTELWSYTIGVPQLYLADLDREGNSLVATDTGQLRILNTSGALTATINVAGNFAFNTPAVFLKDGRIATYERDASDGNKAVNILIYSRTGTLLKTIATGATGGGIDLIPDYGNTFWAYYQVGDPKENTLFKFEFDTSVDSKLLSIGDFAAPNNLVGTFKPI